MLLRPTSGSIHVRRVHHVLLLHLQAEARVVPAFARQLAEPCKGLGVDAGDIVDTLGGDVSFREGEGLDAHGEGVVADFEDLGRLGVGEAEKGFGTLEEGGRVGGLFGNAGLEAGFFHRVEVLVA